MSIFVGSAAAVITPFSQNGAVDFKAFENQLKWQIESGTDALVVCGTTGECATISEEEFKSVIDFAVRLADGRVPVIAGTGKNDTKHSLKASLLAQGLGAKGLLMVTPYYNKTTQDGLIQHYTYIADRVSLPIILYNVPSRTGMSISADTYKKLSKHPNIVGTKEASGDFSHILQVFSQCPDFDIYCGNDDQIVPMLALGAKGVISTMANIIPKETRMICESWFNKDAEKAAKIQMKYSGVIKALFSETNPIPVKAAMQMMGMDCGLLRLPLVEMSSGGKEKMRKAMEEVGII